MKNRVKESGRWLFGGLLGSILWVSCGLDYENTGVISPDDVWKDAKMIQGYLSDIHGGKMPGWPGAGDGTDEALSKAGGMGDYARGIFDKESGGTEFNYEYIDKINFLLDKLTTVPTTVLSQTENEQVQGQALFWRAWDYFGKVNTFGGVPLILKPQNVMDRPSLFVPRNKTSECMAQILKDLDDAITYLPDTWEDANYGRIDKATAMAFKGRVLLYYASPVFNETNDPQRWEDAYVANKAAVDFLKGVGKGLYPDYRKIWKDERNKEVVMVNQYYYPDHTTDQAGIRPEPLTTGSANYDQPILSLLLAYPLKDGSALTLDPARLKNDPAYNAAFFTDFLENRDERFYTTIFCPGTEYPSADREPGGILSGGQRYWDTWKRFEDGSYVSMIADQMNKPIGEGISGFYKLKGLDETLDRTHKGEGKTDWVEIRFAEVLMNYGECANELDKKEEALDVLYQIRQRAGIEAGVQGVYGIAATSQTDIREAYINERFVEFAFEGKRWDDLRRWKRWDILNNLKHRAGLYFVINDPKNLETFKWHWDITNPEVRNKFHVDYIPNLDGLDKYTFNYTLDHWFSYITKKDLEKNSKLEQNKEWGGMFDPLQ